MRLGSGLDPAKLADTLRQPDLASGKAVLACVSPDVDHAWVQLTADPHAPLVGNDPSNYDWHMTLGYPSGEEPHTEFTSAGFDLPSGVRVVEWQAGLFVKLALPGVIEASNLAELIIVAMQRIQFVGRTDPVEITLEYHR